MLTEKVKYASHCALRISSWISGLIVSASVFEIFSPLIEKALISYYPTIHDQIIVKYITKITSLLVAMGLAIPALLLVIYTTSLQNIEKDLPALAFITAWAILIKTSSYLYPEQSTKIEMLFLLLACPLLMIELKKIERSS